MRRRWSGEDRESDLEALRQAGEERAAAREDDVGVELTAQVGVGRGDDAGDHLGEAEALRTVGGSGEALGGVREEERMRRD